MAVAVFEVEGSHACIVDIHFSILFILFSELYVDFLFPVNNACIMLVPILPSFSMKKVCNVECRMQRDEMRMNIIFAICHFYVTLVCCHEIYFVLKYGTRKSKCSKLMFFSSSSVDCNNNILCRAHCDNFFVLFSFHTRES